MSSVSIDHNGNARVQFIGLSGKRHSIRPGRISRKRADALGVRLDALVAVRRVGQQPDRETAVWLADLPDKLRKRLVVLGVADPVARNAHTLADLLREFTASATAAVKRSTLVTYQQTVRSLLDALGPARPLTEIGTHDADRFRSGLLAGGLADATVGKRVKTARQAFKLAVRWGWIAANPFDGIRAGAQVNAARQAYIGHADAARVLAACPDAEWRLIFALARYAGLRCSSEVLRLTWADVLWSEDRFIVRATKTEHHADGGVRVVPMFPLLRPHLLAAFDAADAGAVHAIEHHRLPSKQYGTQMKRIIERAGLVPWPKVFVNLRASCATDLAHEHPGHVAAAWLGHTDAIAQQHYRQTTEADFERATKAAQNPGAAPARSGRNQPASRPRGATEKPGFAGPFRRVQVGATCPIDPNGIRTRGYSHFLRESWPIWFCFCQRFCQKRRSRPL